MILGIFQIFAGGLIGDLWLILIGMFLKGIAASGYQEIVMGQFNHDVPVEDMIVEDLVKVAPDLSLSDVVDGYFLKYGYGGFPVVTNGSLVGMVNLANIKDLCPVEPNSKNFGEVMMPL